MPLVDQLSEELNARLGDVAWNLYGTSTNEVRALWGHITAEDSTAQRNYERLFSRVATILAYDPVGKWRSPAAAFATNVGSLIGEVLENCHLSCGYDPSYLTGLAALNGFASVTRVFSLNYDLCVEDACRRNGSGSTSSVGYTTGFTDSDPGFWDEALLDALSSGVVLHKLHGSLSWRRESCPYLTRQGFGLAAHPIVQIDWRATNRADIVDSPREIVLGPAPKPQADLPFVALVYRFYQAAARAAACVIVGYSFADDWVNNILEYQEARGLALLDVNTRDPTRMVPLFLRIPPSRRVREGARSALSGTRSLVLQALQREGLVD